MTSALKKAIRTFFQAFVATIIASGVFSNIETEAVIDWSVLKKVVISAIVSGAVALVTWIHNTLEDKDVIPKALRNG